MKLGVRIFLAYVLLTALCFSYPLSRFFGELRTLFVENVEGNSLTVPACT